MVLVATSVWLRFLAGRQPSVRARRLRERGIGWVDTHLLASTLIAGARLWTADARLAEIAAETGVAFTAT